MKRLFIAFIIALFLFAGCKAKYRIYTLGALDRMTQTDGQFIKIQEKFQDYGVIVVDEDSVEKSVDKSYLRVQRLRMGASARADRLDGAVALGKKIGVDAILYSTMPQIGLKTKEDIAVGTDSLIALYVVDPPGLILEARNYDDFLKALSELDWRTIARPPAKPEEFIVKLDEKLKYAGLTLEVEEATEQEIPATTIPTGTFQQDSTRPDDRGVDFPHEQQSGAQMDQGTGSPTGSAGTNNPDDKSRAETAGGSGSPPLESQTPKAEQALNDTTRRETAPVAPQSGKWVLLVSEGYHVIRSERFDIRAVNKIPDKLNYDVALKTEGEETTFKLVLTDLR
jgi:hypothetical protein